MTNKPNFKVKQLAGNMAELLTYASYYNQEEVDDLTRLLDEHQVPYLVERSKALLDPVYIGNEMSPMLLVRMPSDRFEFVNSLVRRRARAGGYRVNPDYYLFGFSNQELEAVVRSTEEWTPFDQGLAERILKERNVEYSTTPVETAAEATVRPQKLPVSVIVVQYLLAIVWPFAGIIIGLATNAAFRTLQSGNKIRMYDDNVRLHGKILLAIGILRTIQFYGGLSL